MLLLLSLLDTDTPIDKFLKGCVKVQKDKEAVLSVVQCCIMHELLSAVHLYEDGKMDTAEVPLKHIQEKYGLERYTVSRNAVMLSKEGIKDKRASDGVREGKGWVKSQDYIPNPKKVKNIKDRPPSDSRLKSLVLTTKGRNVAEIMFR